VVVPQESPDPVAVRITDMLGEEIFLVEPRAQAIRRPFEHDDWQVDALPKLPYSQLRLRAPAS
jgi:hypothetical protein